jgi:hypothetical protein
VPQPRIPGDALDKPPAHHALHPNTSLNFQLNRWLAWMTAEALPDLAAAAAGVRGYADFTSAFLDLGDRLLAEGRRLDAFCYRAAEFFLKPSDGRKARTRRRFVELVRDVYGIGPQHMASVPFGQGALPAYRFGDRAGGRSSSSVASTATSRSSSRCCWRWPAPATR